MSPIGKHDPAHGAVQAILLYFTLKLPPITSTSTIQRSIEQGRQRRYGLGKDPVTSSAGHGRIRTAMRKPSQAADEC